VNVNALETETLLAAQLTDLVRYRDMLEGQRAVARMGDGALLEGFTLEATGLIAVITRRDNQLRDLHLAAEQAGARSSRAGVLQGLHARVEEERARAVADAGRLADELSRATPALAAQISSSTRELDLVLHGYNGQSDHGGPSLIDRRG
jgi:hypothetical protein